MITIPSHGWFMTLLYPHYIRQTQRTSFDAGTEVQGLASLAVVPDKHAVHRRPAAVLNTPCWVLLDQIFRYLQVGSGALV